VTALTEDKPGFTVVGICHLCARRTSVWACAAFPDGIPRDVLIGKINHRLPTPGDRGLRFEPKRGGSDGT